MYVPMLYEPIVVAARLASFIYAFDLTKHSLCHLQRRDVFEVRVLDELAILHVLQSFKNPVRKLLARK